MLAYLYKASTESPRVGKRIHAYLTKTKLEKVGLLQDYYSLNKEQLLGRDIFDQLITDNYLAMHDANRGNPGDLLAIIPSKTSSYVGCK